MREIKFRAWDKKEKRMVYDIQAFYGSWWDILKDDNWIVMQYTGLKDKNGKEIYEGDMITCGATQREIYDVIEEGTCVVVKYEDGYFYPFGFNAGWRSGVYDIEIIGNVYENPELIK